MDRKEQKSIIEGLLFVYGDEGFIRTNSESS